MDTLLFIAKKIPTDLLESLDNSLGDGIATTIPLPSTPAAAAAPPPVAAAPPAPAADAPAAVAYR